MVLACGTQAQSNYNILNVYMQSYWGIVNKAHIKDMWMDSAYIAH